MKVNYTDFLIILTGAPGAYQVAAYGPNGISVPVTPSRWEPTDAIGETLYRLANGYTLERQQAETLGAALYNALFPRPVAGALAQAQASLPDQTHLRLKLAIQPPELAVLPWEIMYDPEQQFFLAARLTYPIVRLVESSQPVSAAGLKPPISVLYARSQPKDLPELKLADSEQALRSALRETARITTLSPVTPSGLRDQLRADYAFFHFDGHAAFYEAKQEGFLYLEDENGQTQRWSGELLASYLEGSSLRLVVLAACQSGMGSERQRFAGIAHQLMKSSSLPAVVAMQFPIPDEAAIAFIRSFYSALAARLPLEAAVLEGRRAILESARGDRLADLDWATPVLFLRGDGQLFYTPEDEPAPGESPYKGLQYFDESDADLFFGRGELSRNLANRLRAGNFLAVVGASGSGKSSVVRAGLLPILRQAGGWTIVPPFTPGMAEEPLLALANAIIPLLESGLSPLDGLAEAKKLAAGLRTGEISLREVVGRILQKQGSNRLALVVDQFEELFTTFRDKTNLQMEFVQALLNASHADSPLTVIFTLRADFYAPCAQFEALRTVLEQRQAIIGPMTSAELRQAIEEPARQGGWVLEDGLVEMLLRDVGDEPGNLPLLSHALLETWQQRKGRTLTLQAYQQSGGVHGAIARTADAVLSSLSPEQQEIARRIFLGLTELGEGTQDTRRRATLEEIAPRVGARPAAAAVLKMLADARLVTTSDQAAEVAHEALIREWPTLRRWLDADRQSLRLYRELNEDAHQWVELKRDSGALYRGARLAAAREWAAAHQADMTDLDQEFLRASQDAVEAEEQQREAQRKRELDQARRLAQSQRQRTVILAIGLGVSLLLMLVAITLWQQSGANLLQAQNNAGTATFALGLSEQRGIEAAESASMAQTASVKEAEQARAAETARARAEDQTRIALARALAEQAQSPGSAPLEVPYLLALQSLKLLPTRENRQVLWDNPLPQLASIWKLDGDVDAISPDGQHLLTGSSITLTVRDAATGSRISSSVFPTEINISEFSPDGRLVVTNGCRTMDGRNCAAWMLRVWEAATGREVASIADLPRVTAFAFSPDGKDIFLGEDKVLYGLNLATQQSIVNMRTGETIYDLAFTSDGMLVVLNYQEVFTLNMYNPAAKENISILLDTNGLGVISPDGRYLAYPSVESDMVVQVLELESRKEFSIGLEGGVSGAIAFSHDSRLVAAGNLVPGLRVNPVNFSVQVYETASGQLKSKYSHGNNVVRIAFSPDDRSIISEGEGDHTALWDAATGSRLAVLQTYTIFGKDGQTLISPDYSDDTLRLWSVNRAKTVQTVQNDLPVKNGLFISDGRQVLTGNSDFCMSSPCETYVRLWDVETGRETALLPTEGPLAFVRASPAGRYLAAYSQDNGMYIWESATKKNLLKEKYVQSVAFSPDGVWTALGNLNHLKMVKNSGFSTAWQVDLDSYDPVGEIAFSPDSQQVLAFTPPNTITLMESGTGKLVKQWFYPQDAHLLAFSPDASSVAAELSDGDGILIQVRETGTGKELFSQPFVQTVDLLAFSPDSKLLAAVSSSVWSAPSSIAIWDLRTTKKVADLKVDAHIWAAAISPDDRYLLLGAGVARIIEIASGVEVARMQHGDTVNAVAFSPDGKFAFSGSGGEFVLTSMDNSARVWLWRPADLIDYTCQHLPRNLTRAEWAQYIGEALPYQAVCPNLPIEPQAISTQVP